MVELSTSDELPKLPTRLAQNFLGDTLEVVENDYVSDAIVEYGAYAFHELSMFGAIFSQLPVRNCLEIGANIGNHTAFFSRYFEHTYAFEPNPLVYKILTGNIERNNLRATAYRFGISNESGVLEFYINRANLGASSFIKGDLKHVTSIIECAVKCGDEIIEQRSITDIDCIKIDAEGLEGKVVKGLAKTIKCFQPLVCLEWKTSETRDDFTRYKLFETVFDDYIPLAISRHFPIEDYDGWFKRIQRSILKHVIYRNQKKNMRFIPFHSHGSYSMVFFFPKRFAQLIKKNYRATPFPPSDSPSSLLGVGKSFTKNLS